MHSVYTNKTTPRAMRLSRVQVRECVLKRSTKCTEKNEVIIEIVAVTECSEPLIHVTLTSMALASIAAAAAAAYIAIWPTHKINEYQRIYDAYNLLERAVVPCNSRHAQNVIKK